MKYDICMLRALLRAINMGIAGQITLKFGLPKASPSAASAAIIVNYAILL
jgi:hypothetical protein